MNAIKNITIGHTERLYKPVGYTMLANLVNIIPFCLSIEAVRIIFAAFDGSGRPLDTARLWCIFGILAVYMLVMALAERASYRANFRGAYEMSASGRFHRVSEKHADGSRRSFGEREKYGDETLRPILRPAAGACPFRWRSDERYRT